MRGWCLWVRLPLVSWGVRPLVSATLSGLDFDVIDARSLMQTPQTALERDGYAVACKAALSRFDSCQRLLLRTKPMHFIL